MSQDKVQRYAKSMTSELDDGRGIEVINQEKKRLKPEGSDRTGENRVTKPDLKNKTTLISPGHGGGKNLKATVSEKRFLIGDRVIIISGRHENQTGWVLRMEEKQVIILSDTTFEELVVLHMSAISLLHPQMASNTDPLEEFQPGDMVQLVDEEQNSAVGVIVRLEADYTHVLTTDGKVEALEQQRLRRRQPNSQAVALDCKKNKIMKNDVVKAVDGTCAGRIGRVHIVYRHFVFITSGTMTESGIFLCRSRHLQKVNESYNLSTPGPSRASDPTPTRSID